MQTSQEQVLLSAGELVANLDETIIRDLCSEEREKRGKAVNAILGRLNPRKNPDDYDVLQALPIALIASGDHIGTLYFLQYCIENGAFFDLKVISAVIDEIATARAQCIEDEDVEAVGVISNVLHRFYNTLLANREYQKRPEIYLSIGTDQERNNDVFSAIGFYNEAMGLGSVEAYFSVACAYESQGNYDMSATVFDAGYQISSEERFLHRHIHALCKAGKRDEAYVKYQQLRKNSKAHISPFIVYVGTIHSDDDLHELELLMTAYHMESTFEPQENLRELAVQASIYISNEIEKESTRIEGLNSIPLDMWTSEQDTAFRDSIKRRLYLMQTHIITLQDPRYIDFYIDETGRYIMKGNDVTRTMMGDYFGDFFSPHALASYQKITQDETSNIEEMELLESMRIHLMDIAGIFSQHSYYELRRDTLVPFVEYCMKNEGIFDTEDEDINSASIMYTKNESEHYDTLSCTTRKMYETYIEFIDKKYGMFYRRSIQGFAREEEDIPAHLKKEYESELEKHHGDKYLARNTVVLNMQVWSEYPDIALLFFLEKILLGQEGFITEEGTESFMQKYRLDTLISLDTLLLGSMLYENGEHEAAFECLINSPGMLDVPQALFMLVEWLRYTETDKARKEIVKKMNTVCRREYDAKSFSEHISLLAQDVFEEENPSDDDVGYVLLAHANMKIVEHGDSDNIVRELKVAGAHGLHYGHISAGDILKELNKDDEALECYQKAYLLNPDIVSMRRILDLLLGAKRWSEAWEYIEMALIENYSVSGYISAWYLYQGKTKEALEQMCKAGNDTATCLPEQYPERLSEAIQGVLNTSLDPSLEQEHLNILASYLNACFFSEASEAREENLIRYIDHVGFIGGFLDEQSGEEANRVLLSTLPIFVGEIEFSTDISDTQKSMNYLHMHLVQIQNRFIDAHKASVDERNIKTTIKIFELNNALSISAMALLERFPDSLNCLEIWRECVNLRLMGQDQDSMLHQMPKTIQ